MSDTLVISVRLHEGWYHGAGSIPSPARLFQSLIAGQGLSGPLPDATTSALQWLEKQPPPIVAAPLTKGGQAITTFVPNNDLDAKQGDPRRIGEIRTKKTIRPLIFDVDVPFLFCWNIDDPKANQSDVQHVCELANRVYQLGRTVDAAWAWSEVVSDDELNDKIQSHRGSVFRPSTGHGHVECPTAGSFESLQRRYNDMSSRYAMTSDGKGQTFRRRAKPKWRMVSYDNAVTRVCFDLLDHSTSALASWSATKTVALTKIIRDEAVRRLVEAIPFREVEIQRTLIGQKANGENAGPASARVRIVPLPSIGHEHTDQQIRRVLVEIPSTCPISAEDIRWAFSGQRFALSDRTIDLARSQPHRQLEHYGIEKGTSRTWQSVTPIALTAAARRRIEPNRHKRAASDFKGAAERRTEQELAAAALHQALRHAGVKAKPTSIRVQREPFTARGQKADDFATDQRFNRHVLWHAEIQFDQVVSGPVVLGDGRFLGLGLFRPIERSPGVFAFAIEAGFSHPEPVRLAKSLRRAVMARVRDTLYPRHLPTYFSGHTKAGAPADSQANPHLTFVFDPERKRLLVIQPELFGRSTLQSARQTRTLESALQGFENLLAGADGHLRLCQIDVEIDSDPLFAMSRTWDSVTPYEVNRHLKKSTADETIIADVQAECQRRNLPPPIITNLKWTARSRGLQGTMRLEFPHPVAGPIVLGKTRHHGGGVFQMFTQENPSHGRTKVTHA